MIRLISRYSVSVCLLILAAQTTSVALGQSDIEGQRALDHADYDRWQTSTDQRISHDGKWILYSTRSGKSDAESTVKIRRNGTTKEYAIERASGARFSFDSKHIVYRITPAKAKLKALQKAKTKPEDLPAPVLEILELESGDKFSVERVKSFLIPAENGRWLAYQFDKDPQPKSVKQQTSEVVETYEVTEEGLRRPEKTIKLKKRPTEESPAEAKQKSEEEARKKAEAQKLAESKTAESKKTSSTAGAEKDDDEEVKKEKAVGTTLVLRDLKTGLQLTYPHVTRYWFSKNGSRLAFMTSVEPDEKAKKKAAGADSDDKKASVTTKPEIEDPDSAVDGVFVVDLDDLETTRIATGEGEYKNLAFNEDGSQLAFLANKDDYQTKTPSWSRYITNTACNGPTSRADRGCSPTFQEARESPRTSTGEAVR